MDKGQGQYLLQEGGTFHYYIFDSPSYRIRKRQLYDQRIGRVCYYTTSARRVTFAIYFGLGEIKMIRDDFTSDLIHYYQMLPFSLS